MKRPLLLSNGFCIRLARPLALPIGRAPSFGRSPDRAGFTIVELAVVVAILAILCLCVATNHRRSQPRYHLERATARLATDLCSARMKAISECMPVTVTFNAASNTYVICSDSNTNGIIDANERCVEILDPSIQMLMGGCCTQGVFSARGRFSASVPFWLIRLNADHNDERRLIYVLPNGQVRCTTNELSTNAAMAYQL